MMVVWPDLFQRI